MSIAPVHALRSLLDLYSPRPASRVAVLACMAIGAWLLARAFDTGSGLGVIPFALLVWANHERFLGTVEELLRARPWAVIAVPLAVFAARLLFFPPTASDDLLRHIAQAFWPGGYRDMYVATALPPVDLYPAFDRVVGGLARVVGPAPAMWLVQALAWMSFVLVFVLAVRRLSGAAPMWPTISLVALVLVLQVMSARLFLGRPEVFMMIWALSAVLVRGGRGAVAWAVAGVALGGGYWLAPIYFPAVMLLPLGRRARVGVLAAMGLAWGLMWWWLSDGGLVEAVRWTLDQVANRIPGLQVQENASLAGVLLMPQMLLLVFGACWAATRRESDHRLAWLAGWFMLSNQVRYGGVIAPLLALYVVSAMGALPARWPRRSATSIVALAAVSLSMLANGVPRFADLPRFRLPTGAVVLTGFTEASYATPFFNPGTVKVAPAFEVGAAEPRVQRLAMQLGNGRLDCDALAGLPFTHVIERGLSGPAPDCLRLSRIQREWRLWELVH